MNYNKILNEQNYLSMHLKDIIFKQQQFIDKQSLEIKKLKDENKKLKNQKKKVNDNQVNDLLKKLNSNSQSPNETTINESLLEQVFNKCLEKNLQNLNKFDISNYSSTNINNVDHCLKPSNIKSMNYSNSIDSSINNNDKDNEIELTKQSSMNLNLVMNELKERFGQ